MQAMMIAWFTLSPDHPSRNRVSAYGTARRCNIMRTPTSVCAMLEAAGKNLFDAYDLKWTDQGWDFADNTVMAPTGIVWERVWPVIGLAFIPPVVVLVIVSAFRQIVRAISMCPRFFGIFRSMRLKIAFRRFGMGKAMGKN